LDAFCLVPLSLRSAWRRRVAPNLNKKVENATLKNYSAYYSSVNANEETITENKPRHFLGPSITLLGDR